ncbi:MAG: 3-phosphoshikimate 1-carboxyvinyltransferase [Chromatiales bacterium]|nr:3-phosphoshikimate 1-carboxyvinyltransferase [Chromatiales bacterium]
MSSTFTIRPSRRVAGTMRVPGDKSISHRALMLGAIASGKTRVSGFLPGEDCMATLAAVRAMGIDVEQHDATTITVMGKGLHGLRAASGALDMGNSGTAMRLFMGLLAAQDFDSKLIGDESLSRRPMERVAVPLRLMGAEISTTDGKPPVHISGRRKLQGIRYDMPVASAQLKSALLLAGLYADGDTVLAEPAVTRDHTERMLASLGQPVRRDGKVVSLSATGQLNGTDINVPGDLSSAAFFVLAGCLAAEGELVIDNVGLNPTRTGILRILELMGADLRVEPATGKCAEPVGRLVVRPSELQGVAIPPELVPLAIDEFPMVFVAAALARGETLVSGAAELRHKESDRISVMVAGLRTLGIEVDELPDGARIRGGRFSGGTIDSHGDHRVAMSFAIGAARAAGPVQILDTANVATSFPGFVRQASAVGLVIEADAGG